MYCCAIAKVRQKQITNLIAYQIEGGVIKMQSLNVTVN